MDDNYQISLLHSIAVLEEEIRIYESQLKPQFLIDDDDEYQEQLELRWHISDLKDELENLKKKNVEFLALRSKD